MKQLKPRQKAILDYINKHQSENGYPPSMREIGQAVGLASPSTVYGHLERLQKRGYLSKEQSKPRTIEINHKPNTQAVRPALLPVVGKVTAGVPITAVQNIEEYFVLPESQVRTDKAYMLRVQGESMIEAGILDGDYVIVRPQASAENGEIVVAMTEENEATVKRFFREEGYYRLQPENSAMQPIILDRVSLLGKVIGVYRNIPEPHNN